MRRTKNTFDPTTLPRARSARPTRNQNKHEPDQRPKHRPTPRQTAPPTLQIRRSCNDMVLCAAHVRMEKDFDRWNEIKKATDAADEAARLYFREGEVWWVRLGHNIGYEANGKSREFTRPIIILKKYNQYSFLALPLTTVPKPNPYRLPVGMVDGMQAFATLSQLCNIDSKRLVKKIMHLDADIFIAIKKEASRVNFG